MSQMDKLLENQLLVTGLGSLPGTDIRAVTRQTLGILEDFGYLPELPARGVWGQMLARSIALLDGLGVELLPFGWCLTSSKSSDQNRAKSLLREDLDALEEAAQGYEGRLKVSFCGPWTLAAALSMPRADRVLVDRGARTELASCLTEGIADLLSELHRRLDGIDFVLQLDEPGLGAVVNGTIPNVSGLRKLPAIGRQEVSEVLEELVVAVQPWVGTVICHCCAGPIQFEILQKANFDAVAAGLGLINDSLDQLASWVESGNGVWLGILPAEEVNQVPRIDQLVRNFLELFETMRVELDLTKWTLTPSCGLASWDESTAGKVFEVLLQSRKLILEQLND